MTGGAGFVGSSLCIRFKEWLPAARIVALDNLGRRGSELNVPRLREHGVEFVRGDVRNREDLERIHDVDVVVDCAAEPSVLAGFSTSPIPAIETNLIGTINCLELARRERATFVFLSTSRVYPIRHLNDVPYRELDTRYEWVPAPDAIGVSGEGISERFPIDGDRSLYGATKLCAEILLQEYVTMYGLRGIVNRCGVIAGPWQMGRVDQGVVTFWVAQHYFRRPLRYIGFGGHGKQVRDILHVDDLFELVRLQLVHIEEHTGRVYNVGGGRGLSVSLTELTALSRAITGNEVPIGKQPENRPADVRIYVGDTATVRRATGWEPKIGLRPTIEEIASWIDRDRHTLERIL